MPAVSEKQQKKMGIALSMKRGKTPESYSPEAAEIAESMSEKKLEEMASFNPSPNPKSIHSFGNPNAILDMFKIFEKGWWF